MQDRLSGLNNQETLTDRENREAAAAAIRRQQAQNREGKFQSNTASIRDTDMMRTKQQANVRKLIEKINDRTKNLIASLPEHKGGGGNLGKLKKNYNSAMKTMEGFINKYQNSSPEHNTGWATLSDKRKRELLYFHRSLSSNDQHYRAISQLNTAKKKAEETAAEANLGNFRDNMSIGKQQNLDRWFQYLDIPVALVSAPLVSAPLVSDPLVSAPLVSAPLLSAPLVSAPLVSAPLVSAQTSAIDRAHRNRGGRKTRKRKTRKHKRHKTRKHKRRKTRKHKKRKRRKTRKRKTH